MPEMQFDFDGLIQLLAGHLYSEKKVFIRELIQNSHDAIQRRAVKDPDFNIENGRIDIYTDLGAEPPIIRFRDNGIGMSKQDLEEYLSSVGSSGTKANRDDAPDVIGQFGIGFLSGFVVAERIQVDTKASNEADKETGWRWENTGRKDYQLQATPLNKVGTEVTIDVGSAEDHGLIRDDAIREVVRTYADMLKIPIYLNYSETPINQRIMPWERDVNDEELDIDCRVYLEKNMQDSVLEVIPLKETGSINVSGVLYITRTRVIGRDAPRETRVFQKRMFLCENTPEILPKWASFVNGVINTPDLSPNAARDNFRRDAAFEQLREYLGEKVIAHFEKLQKHNRERLSEILAYHDFAIKAACHYYDVFFEKFGHLLEWRVNNQSNAAKTIARPSGRRILVQENPHPQTWVTLPDLVTVLPESQDGLKRLHCFTTSSSANQFFEMANAAGSTVLDASMAFEDELIKTWAQKHPEVRLVYVDREDDPNVYQLIDPQADRKVQELAQHMSLYVRPGGGRIRVEAKRFEPSSLPAVLKSSPDSSGSTKAREILSDPNASASLRDMAEQMLRMARNEDMRMNINASNPLIRQLAHLGNFEDEEVIDLMGAIYNDAILYNQELMTPTNAKIFHEQFGRLLQRSVEYFKQRDELLAFKQQQIQQNTPKHSRRHKVAFYITPFAETFKPVRAAVRQVIENQLGCQLLSADEHTYDALISGNVQRHIDAADFFVADVTGANPNVMLEIGAVQYGRSDSPMLLIAGLAEGQTAPDLIADLKGHIACTYQQTATEDQIASELAAAFVKNHPLKQLLADKNREVYLSPDSLKHHLGQHINLPDNTYRKLCERFNTVSDWQQASENEVAELLGNAKGLASFLLLQIHNTLTTKH